jgi:cytochrome oxidase Cu insertion factor (SCO1/SenC/PrrC family)
MEDSHRRGRRVLLLLAAIFLVPVLLAFALYYGNVWRPSGSSSKGELITPARPLNATGLRLPDGTPAGGEVLQGKWSIVYLGDGACDTDCRASLVYARQSRLALNNEMTRVQIVMLATADCCADLAQHVPGIRVVDASSPEAAPLLAQFPAERRAQTLYIVDPLGNLMMRHPAAQTSKDLLTDLKKLLKLSHIG